MLDADVAAASGNIRIQHMEWVSRRRRRGDLNSYLSFAYSHYIILKRLSGRGLPYVPRQILRCAQDDN